MSPTSWLIKAYDLQGNPLSIPDMKGLTGASEAVLYADDRMVSIPQNGLDQLSGKVMLEDPAAAFINKKTCVLKMWRTIDDPVRGAIKSYVAGEPDFAGPVIATNVAGESGYKTFTAVNPLWRMQSRFHTLNHHLANDTVLSPDYPSPYQLTCNGDNQPFDASALMYRMIALIQAQATPFQRSDDGIRRPLTKDYSGTPGVFVGTGAGNDYWPKTIQVSPYFIAKGSSTWAEIYDDVMQRASHPDIVPEYIHSDGDRKLMYFKTQVHRGSDKSASVSFDYHTGEYNLADINVDETLTPGKYGNFVWIVGDGGPNVYIALAEDVSDEMEFTRTQMLVQVQGGLKTDLDPIAPAQLAVGKLGDAPVFQLTHLPSGEGLPYYDVDYGVGDVVMVNAEKGQWSITNVKQRIYQVDLHMDKNNVETAQVLVATDYLGAIAPPSSPSAPLTAAFIVSPQSGTAPFTATFTDTSTPGPSGPITAWAWDFGDGGTSTLQNPTHNYTTPGFYWAELTVTGTGSDGTSSTMVLIGVL